MTAIGLTILIVLMVVILLMPRQWAALGVIAGVIYLTAGQHLYIGGLNIFAIRFIEVAGIIRIISKKEFSFEKLTIIDKSFIVFQCVYLLAFFIRSVVETSLIETRAYRIGFLVDGLMSYFIFRGLLNDPTELKLFLKKCAILIIPFALFMGIEGMTGKNLFFFMGGVPEIPVLRDEYYRSQASFGVAITAGSFGATMLPLFIYTAISPDGRLWGTIGVIACLVITITSHSSGPLLGFIAGISAWMCWSLRTRMREVRWAIVGFFIVLQLMMKPPIWFIFSKISAVIGGEGWHRSNLIDQFVNHFKDWWLMGMSLEKTGNWAATRLESGSVDVTNAYVAIGISGGLISLLLFIRLIVKCYRSLGASMQVARGDLINGKQNELLLWGIGCTLFTHVVNITAVRYWDQMFVIWYMTLALVSSITAYFLQVKSKEHVKGVKISNIYSMDNDIMSKERKTPLIVD